MHHAPMTRRHLLGLGAAFTLPVAWGRAAAESDAIDRLRRGGVVVLLRHALTTPGVGDPPGFLPGQCATQRNLSDAGREQARGIGRWFEKHQLVPAAVRSSAWCRCIDTAQLAFGRHELWSALDSFFEDRATEPARRAQVAQALAQLAPGRFEVWVTHQVNVTSATGNWVSAGEGVVVAAADRPSDVPARIEARLAFSGG